VPAPLYAEIPLGEAYALLNTGGVVLVCTVGEGGRYDLAPIAWSCPLDYEPLSRFLVVMDPGHLSAENLVRERSFALALPTWDQLGLVEKTGSISGRKVDKYETCGIPSFPARTVNARIPEGVAGWVECRLLEARPLGSVLVVAGEATAASAVDDAWKYRLHHAGGSTFYRPDPLIR